MENKVLGAVKTREPSTSPDLGKQRKKKFTGGNASKRHRDRVNIEFNNLAKLLPFSESVIAKLDKSSILRLAVSYIRAKSFFKDIKNILQKDIKTKQTPPINNQFEECTGMLSEMFSKALAGFLLVLTEDMKVLFVSESVREYLGYCQAGIIHENFLQFVNPADEQMIKKALKFQSNELVTNESDRFQDAKEPSRRNVARKFVCRMKCAFSCSSRFYTAYRTFEFIGHLRRSMIQEGREEKAVNTLVVFCTPLNVNGNSSPVDVIHEVSNKTANPLVDDAVIYEKSGGFRIEPTLRPHIAPIPVKNHEALITRQRMAQQPKLNPAPSLIPVDTFDRHNYVYTSTVPTYRMSAGYQTSSSCESRYSDHSDDSKCSPVSSPNLAWKVNRDSSPSYDESRKFEYLTTHPRSMKEVLNIDSFALEKYRRSMLLKADIDSLRHPTENYKVYTDYEKDDRDVFVGAKMLMNLKHMPNSQQIRVRKRPYVNSYNNHPAKRSKSTSPPRSNSFNISYLLGFDDNKKLEQIQIKSDISYSDQHVDVCEIDDDSTKGKQMHEIIHSMSQNLDAAFRKTMSNATFRKTMSNVDLVSA